MLSVRVLLRHKKKILALTEYYFGLTSITEYHVYLFTSYALVIALGLYFHLYLKESIVLVSCIFIPLLYLCLLGIGVSWANNQYDILANIPEYNEIMEKKYMAKKKKMEMVSKN